jgi:hypothetical protein
MSEATTTLTRTACRGVHRPRRHERDSQPSSPTLLDASHEATGVPLPAHVNGRRRWSSRPRGTGIARAAAARAPNRAHPGSIHVADLWAFDRTLPDSIPITPPPRGRFSPTGSLANRSRDMSCALNRRRRAAAARLKTLCSLEHIRIKTPSRNRSGAASRDG